MPWGIPGRVRTSSCLAPLDAFARLSSFQGGFFQAGRGSVTSLRQLDDTVRAWNLEWARYCQGGHVVLDGRAHASEVVSLEVVLPGCPVGARHDVVGEVWGEREPDCCL